MMKSRMIYGVLFLVLGTVLGFIAATQFGAGADGEAGHKGQGSREGNEKGDESRDVAYWVAPMDPNFRRDVPGLSPMGMALVPVYADEGGGASSYNGVSIDPRIVANIGVETAKVIRDTKYPVIQTVAHVAYNEKDTAHVHVRASGWIEKLYVRATGDTVQAGDPLFEVYSPELNTAQAEYLQAVSSNGPGLIASAGERLAGLGLSASDIDDLRKTGKAHNTLTVRAPINGVVTALNISDAARIMPDRPTLTLVDLRTVWLVADVFEADVSFVKAGAGFKAFSVNGDRELVNSVVEYVYPVLDMQTRTNPVRAVIENADRTFKPGQFLKVEIERDPIRDALFVPASAVIRLGEGDRVIVAEGDGRFIPVAVTIGETVDGYIQITEGIGEEEMVVISSQFLIDSESSFQGAEIRLTGPRPQQNEELERDTESARESNSESKGNKQ